MPLPSWFFKFSIFVFVPLFRNKFPGLFQDSDWFFQNSKIHINPFTPKISMLILLTVCHTFHIFYLSLTNFQNFPGPAALFQDVSVLENATVKFQNFQVFQDPYEPCAVVLSLNPTWRCVSHVGCGMECLVPSVQLGGSETQVTGHCFTNTGTTLTPS